MKTIITLIAIIFLFTNAAFATPNGLIALWNAEGHFNDVVGGKTGTPVGDVTFAPSASHLGGQAFSMDGSGDFINTDFIEPLTSTWLPPFLRSRYIRFTATLQSPLQTRQPAATLQ